MCWVFFARLIRKRRARRAAQNQAQAIPQHDPDIEPKEGAEGQAGPSVPRSTFWFKMRLLAALLLPVFLETLDYTVVATAQPRIASTFNALSLQSYIGTAYLLSSTVFLPLFASLADVFGRHPGLQLSLLFFLIGSGISAGAVNIAMMLVGRGVAGVGAAGLLTIVRTILSDSRSLDDNNWQTSILFLLYAVSFAIGPLIGGYLVAISFRWVFLINIPVCVVSIILCFVLLRNKVKKGQPSDRFPGIDAEHATFFRKLARIDWIGTLLFVGGGILVLLALNWGSTDAWNSIQVILSWVFGLLLIIACLVWEHVLGRQLHRMTPSRRGILRCDPMLPLEIFRSYNVCAVMYGAFVSGMVMMVMFYFVSIFMTIVLAMTPADAGIQLVFFAPGVGAGSLISIWMISKFRQPKYPIIFGSVILPVSLGLIEWAIGTNNQNQVNGFMVLAGAGVGLTAGPLAIQARFSLPSNRVAVVSSMNLFFRSLGGTVGLAQCSAILNAKVDAYLKSQIASGRLTGPAASAFSATNANHLLVSLASLDGYPPNVQAAVRDAFRYGLRWSFVSLVPWAGVGVFLAVGMRKVTEGQRAKGEEEAREEREAYWKYLEGKEGKEGKEDVEVGKGQYGSGGV